MQSLDTGVCIVVFPSKQCGCGLVSMDVEIKSMYSDRGGRFLNLSDRGYYLLFIDGRIYTRRMSRG